MPTTEILPVVICLQIFKLMLWCPRTELDRTPWSTRFKNSQLFMLGQTVCWHTSAGSVYHEHTILSAIFVSGSIKPSRGKSSERTVLASLWTRKNKEKSFFVSTSSLLKRPCPVSHFPSFSLWFITTSSFLLFCFIWPILFLEIVFFSSSSTSSSSFSSSSSSSFTSPFSYYFFEDFPLASCLSEVQIRKGVWYFVFA